MEHHHHHHHRRQCHPRTLRPAADYEAPSIASLPDRQRARGSVSVYPRLKSPARSATAIRWPKVSHFTVVVLHRFSSSRVARTLQRYRFSPDRHECAIFKLLRSTWTTSDVSSMSALRRLSRKIVLQASKGRVAFQQPCPIRPRCSGLTWFDDCAGIIRRQIPELPKSENRSDDSQPSERIAPHTRRIGVEAIARLRRLPGEQFIAQALRVEERLFDLDREGMSSHVRYPPALRALRSLALRRGAPSGVATPRQHLP